MRLKLVCGLFALIFSSMGMWFVVTDVPFDAAPPAVPDNLQSTLMEIPEDGNIDTLSANENLYISAGELSRSGSFRGVSEGATISMGVSQGIAAQRTVKGDSAFKQSVSFSTFVKLGEQRYVNGTTDFIVRQSDKVNSLDDVTWSNTATPISKETYDERYGYSPTGLTGYILNDSTIVSSELYSKENGLYTFHYVLDVNSAPYFVLFEMRTSAGTSAFPQFLRAELYVTMDANWKVQSLTTDCEYKVALLGGTLCKENLTETFYDIGEVEEVDNTDFFSQYFGKAPEEIGGGAPDPLNELMSIFQPYISEGEQLNADLQIMQANKKLLSGKINATIDIENTDNIVVNAKLDGIADIAYKKGTLYVQSGQFRGSATVDGLMSAIGAITTVAGMPSLDLGGMLDLDSLMEGMTVVKDEHSSSVQLALELGGINLQGAINASIDSNGNYSLTDVTASVAGMDILIKPCKAWQVMSTEGQFNDLTGIFDIIKDGIIAMDVQLADIANMHVQYNLNAGVLNAQSGDLRITLQQNTLYLSFGKVKLQLALSDIPALADELSTLLGSLDIGTGSGIDLGALNLDSLDISSLLGCIYFDSTSDSAQLGVKIDDVLQLYVDIVAKNGKWTLAQIAGTLGEYQLSATPSQVKDYDAIDTQGYVNVADIVYNYLPALQQVLNAQSYGVSAQGNITVDGRRFDYTADIKLDKQLNVNADFAVTYGDTAILHGFVGYVDGIIYIDVNGVKTALNPMALGLTANAKSVELDWNKLQQAISDINPTLGKVVQSILPIIDNITSMDISTIDFGAIVERFEMQDGVLTIGVNGEQFGLGSATIALTSGQQLGVSVDNLTAGELTLNLDAQLSCNVQLERPVAQDYVLGLQINVGDTTAIVNVDLVNMQVAAQANFGGAQLLAKLQNNTVYMMYGNIKLKFDVADIDTVMQYVNQLTDMSGSLELDLYDILSNIRLSLIGDNAVITADIMGIPLSVSFDNVGNQLILGDISATLGNVNINVHTAYGTEVADFATDNSFVDVVEVAVPLLDNILPIVQSGRFSVDFDAQLGTNNNTYSIKGSLSYGNTISTDIALYMGATKVIDANIVYKDNVLYVKANDIAVAIPLGGTSTAQKTAMSDINVLLDSFKGISPELDSILQVATNLINKVSNGTMEWGKLVDSLTYSNGMLVCVLDGDVLGTSDIKLSLSANKGIQLAVDSWTVGAITLKIDASVSEGATDVSVNADDYQLNLVIKLDEVNTIYANIDVLSGIYRFKMGDMNVEYSNNEIKINYKQITVKGNIEQLQLIIDKLEELANNRFVAEQLPDAGTVGGLSQLFSLDIKEILSTLVLTQSGNNVSLSCEVLGSAISVNIVGGAHPQFGTISIALLGKDIRITSENTCREYIDFGTLPEAVEIEKIFNDYYPTLEQLVAADGWHFDLSAEISIGADKYLLKQGSTLDFLYKNAQDFSLKANFVVQKWNGTQYVDYMSLEAIYLNERIYIDYNGLSITIAQQAIEKSVGLYDQLITVVPQIGQLVDELLSAMDQMQGNSQTMDYSKILTEASYNNGVFTLGIDGGVLLDKLGVITLVVSRSQDGLSLNISDLTYDDIKVHSFALNVVPATEQQCLANIGAPDINSYFNLDSLYELLSAFVTTADNNTFRIYGGLTASLVVDIDVGIELYVDVDDQGHVFVTLQISRERLNVIQIENIAFVDYGGNSYLHYNGIDDTITIVRDSYVKDGWFSTKMQYKNYYKRMPAQEFLPNIVDYLMEMINFKQWIRDEITGAMNSESQGNSYEIKDVWTGYGYTSQANGGQFAIKANLEPIDGNLGPLNLYVGHDTNYNLTTLNGDISLLSGWCDITFSLQHTTPQYGIATNYAVNETSWKGVGTV